MTPVQAPAQFGELLRQYRAHSGLTQEELAEQAEMSPRTVGDLERGVQLRPHPGTVLRLAKALDLPAHERTQLLGAVSAGRRGVPQATKAIEPHLEEQRSPLVGRRNEQSVLWQHLSSSGPPLLLLGGEPGIGKTRLLQEAIHQASEMRMVILLGRCDRGSGQDVYSPMTQALQHLIGRQRHSELTTALAGAEWSVRLLPELEGVIEAPSLMGSLAPEQERRLVFEAVSTFLGQCATPSGVLLALDDLQWAGSDALDLLRSVLRRANGMSVRCVGTYRATEVDQDHPLSGLLADLASAELATVAPVGELSIEESIRLLEYLVRDDPHVVAETMRSIVERSGGVPFFLVSFAEGLRSGAYAELRLGQPPSGLTHGVRRRMAALPAATQNVLAAAAVIGRDSATSLLAPVVGRSEEEVLADLSSAWSAGLIREGTERSYQFSHDVIREVVESDLEPPRRVLLHRRVAEALERLPENRPERTPTALAGHFLSGHEPERALTYSLQAGDAAQAVFAHGEAETHLVTAVELATDLGDRQRRAEALEKLGIARRMQGKYRPALEILEDAAEAYHELPDRQGEARAIAQIGRVQLEHGTVGAGLDRVEGFLRTIHPGIPLLLLADLHSIRVAYLKASGRCEEGLRAAEEAGDLLGGGFDDQGAVRMLATVDELRGGLLLELGRASEGAEVLEDALAMAQRVGDIRLIGGILDALSASHDNFIGPVDLKRAVALRRQAIAYIERVGNPAMLAVMLTSLCSYLVRLGRWDEAQPEIERALTLARAADPGCQTANAYIHAGWMQVQAGQWDLAARFLQDGIELLERIRVGDARMGLQAMRGQALDSLIWGQTTLAWLDMFKGAPEAAVERGEGLLERIGSDSPSAFLILVILGLARLDLGDLEQAEVAATQATRDAVRRGDKGSCTLPGLLQAKVAARLGQNEVAVRMLEEVLAIARDASPSGRKGLSWRPTARFTCARGT